MEDIKGMRKYIAPFGDIFHDKEELDYFRDIVNKRIMDRFGIDVSGYPVKQEIRSRIVYSVEFHAPEPPQC